MKIGDLVKMKAGYSIPGIVVRVDRDHYGARQAFKHVGRPRGHCVNSNEVDIIAPTKDGIRDRVMILWPDKGYTYEESIYLNVISEFEVVDV